MAKDLAHQESSSKTPTVERKPPETPVRSEAIPFAGMQRIIGNQAVLRLLESGQIQGKLRVSQPGDADEQEADRIADPIVTAQHAPVIQRKCSCSGGASCSKCSHEEDEEIVHRQIARPLLRSSGLSIQRAPADSSAPATTASAQSSAASGPTHGRQPSHSLVVEDDAPSVAPTQMRKSQFLALLQATACATADAALASVGHTTKGCPYIKKWLDHYKDQDAQHLTRAMNKYAPETKRAHTGYEAISLLNQRIQQAALTWAKTGKVSGLPSDLQADVMGGGGGFLGAIAGFASSGFGSALLGFLGGGSKSESSGAAEGGNVQRKARSADGSDAGTHDAASVRSQLGSGHSLDSRVQSQMSSAFGYDFSGVRVHTDSRSAGLSADLNARAFTIGNDMAFASGEYQPGTLVGDALIAHELAHVVQQNGGHQPAMPMPKGSDSGQLEEDADHSAIGAMLSIWSGVKHELTERAHNAAPRLRSGFKLQRCGHQQIQPSTSARQKPCKPPTTGPSPRPAPVDANAQRIIDLAQGTSPPTADQAVAVVKAIIKQYFANDFSKFSNFFYKEDELGLATAPQGQGPSTTGELAVGRCFVENTDLRGFARSVAQVAHEIEHVDQYRSGLADKPHKAEHKAEREFMAFYHEAIFQELPGTGQIQHATRVQLIDQALGYYYCLSKALQRSNATRRDELLARRTQEVGLSHRHDMGQAPTSCKPQPGDKTTQQSAD